MASQSRFVIRNDLPRTVTLNIEPEGVFLPLGNGEEMSVVDVFTTFPATVSLSHSDQGDLIVSIWPGDGEVRVEKDGVDVLDRVIDRGENRKDASHTGIDLITNPSP